MTRPWVNPSLRFAVYLYFAAGMALLVSDGMVSALRYQAKKGFPASFLIFVFVGIFGIMAFANWETLGRPIGRRKWILLCILSSIGFVELLFAPINYGGAGA